MKSLTIGPQILRTNTRFWGEAFNGLAPLPSVDNTTIIEKYPMEFGGTDSWEYFDRVLARRDLFPALGSVLVQANIGWPEGDYLRDIHNSLRGVRERGLLISKSLMFERNHGADSPQDSNMSGLNLLTIVNGNRRNSRTSAVRGIINLFRIPILQKPRSTQVHYL